MSKTIKVIAVVLVTGALLSLLGAHNSKARMSVAESEPTEQALSATWKNAFISGCKESVRDTITYADEYCHCYYDKLKEIYPDLTTNDDLVKRFLSEGLNEYETDSIVVCIK